jgi:hypothetical protein
VLLGDRNATVSSLQKRIVGEQRGRVPVGAQAEVDEVERIRELRVVQASGVIEIRRLHGHGDERVDRPGWEGGQDGGQVASVTACRGNALVHLVQLECRPKRVTVDERGQHCGWSFAQRNREPSACPPRLLGDQRSDSCSRLVRRRDDLSLERHDGFSRWPPKAARIADRSRFA